MKTLEQKAIELIDHLLTVWDDGIDKDTIAGICYKYAHGVNKECSCYKSHKDWRELVEKDYEEIIIPEIKGEKAMRKRMAIIEKRNKKRKV